MKKGANPNLISINGYTAEEGIKKKQWAPVRSEKVPSAPSE